MSRVVAATWIVLIAGPGCDAAPQPREVSGKVEIEVADMFSEGTSRIEYFVTGDDGIRWRLDLVEGRLSALNAVDRVRVRGLATDSVPGRGVLTVADAHDMDVLGLREAPLGAGPENRRAITIIVDYSDQPVTCTDLEIEDTMYSGALSVDGLFIETSSGAVSFTADTDGDGSADILRVSVAETITALCDEYAIADAADALAVAAGVDLALYQHRLYVLPNNTTCGIGGRAQVGCGDQCRLWVMRCDVPTVYNHEFGHNFGMLHAALDENDDGVQEYEYGHVSRLMGDAWGGWRQVNAPHKAAVGWLPPERIQAVTTSGVYEIALLEVPPSTASPMPPPEVQALTISIPRACSGPSWKCPDQGNYWLSYRAQVSDDTALGTVSRHATLDVGASTYAGYPAWLAPPTGNGGITGQLVDGGDCAAPGNWTDDVALCRGGALWSRVQIANVALGGGGWPRSSSTTQSSWRTFPTAISAPSQR